MPRTFDVYIDSTLTDPISDPRIRPEVFNSYIPPLSLEGIETLDKVLGYKVPEHSVTLNVLSGPRSCPTQERDGSARLETWVPRGMNHARGGKVTLPTRFKNESYPALDSRAAQRLGISKTSRRVPLAELPSAPLRKSTGLASIIPVCRRKSSRARKSMPTTEYYMPIGGNASMAAIVVPPSPHKVTSPIAQQGDNRTLPSWRPSLPVNTQGPSWRTTGTCSSCGSRCSRCKPTKVKKHSKELPHTDPDEDVRKMEGLMTKGRSLKDIIPATARPRIHELWRPKTEVEEWLEGEMGKRFNEFV